MLHIHGNADGTVYIRLEAEGVNFEGLFRRVADEGEQSDKVTFIIEGEFIPVKPKA